MHSKCTSFLCNNLVRVVMLPVSPPRLWDMNLWDQWQQYPRETSGLEQEVGSYLSDYVWTANEKKKEWNWFSKEKVQQEHKVFSTKEITTLVHYELF